MKHKTSFKFQVSSFMALLLSVLLFDIARGAVLYLEPSSGEYYQGDTFIMNIRVDSEEDCVNTVQADLSFPEEILEAIDFSRGDSILTFWLDNPAIDQEAGKISFAGGVPAGFCGILPGDPGMSNLLGRIILKVKEAGGDPDTAQLKFLDTSLILLNDGFGTPAKLTTKGAIIKFTGVAPRQILKDEWQEELEKDKIPPEPFEIKISRDPSVFNGKYFVIFSAADKQTGIDYYEVKEGEKDWKRISSPYMLEDQKLRGLITVGAVDKAGNERIIEYLPETPEEKAFPYWIIVLILAGAGIIYWFIKQGLTGRACYIVVLSFTLCALGLASEARAQNASLYLSPSSGSFLAGSAFTVSIFVDTGGNEINAVFAELRFPPDILQVTSPTQGTSFIENWLAPPTYSNSQGVISFRGGIPGGIKTSAGLISSVTFRAASSGTAKIEFLEESKILLNDGKGTDILTAKRGANFSILFPLPEGPEVFSPTHPDQNSWYSDSSPSFSWDKESLSVSDFSWSFDQNPSNKPDSVSEGVKTQVSFEGAADGTWYFHLRQKKDGVWGKTSTVQVKIDTLPPRPFEARVETYTRFAGYQTMVYFETTDDFSGIGRYEVGLIDLNSKDSPPAFFTEQVSPYKVPFNKAGKYNVIIRAVDKAGNIREAEARFRMLTPIISHIEGRGLEIRGILISWWLFWLVILIILGAALYFLYRYRNMIRK